MAQHFPGCATPPTAASARSTATAHPPRGAAQLHQSRGPSLELFLEQRQRYELSYMGQESTHSSVLWKLLGSRYALFFLVAFTRTLNSLSLSLIRYDICTFRSHLDHEKWSLAQYVLFFFSDLQSLQHHQTHRYRSRTSSPHQLRYGKLQRWKSWFRVRLRSSSRSSRSDVSTVSS